MLYNHSKSLSPDLDTILPYRKENVDNSKIHELTGIKEPDFTGEFGEFQLLYGKSGQRIYLLGLGEKKDEARLKDAFRRIASKTQKNWSETIQIECSDLSSQSILSAVIGLEMSTYKIGVFKSNEEAGQEEEQSVLFISDNEEIQDLLQEGKSSGDSINRIKALVDAPSNIKTPEYLAKWATDSAKEHGYQCTTLDKIQLVKRKFEAILAVGQGSVNEPYLITTEHLPKKEEPVDLVLVGKGITFDTGGLSIKPSQNLNYMKSDMGGAAVVLGVVELAARLKLNINLVGVVATAENSVDANSIRPGDVIQSYSGKTIEVIDTDAEGRLVLADAINYAIKSYNPEQIIDLATLTGSVVRTLGYSAAGMFTENNQFAEKLSEAGNSVYERLWQLPLYDDYGKEMESDIADIKNLSSKPLAGASTAAKFLEAFTESHESWLHLDIAGMAFGDSEYTKMKSASGFGVRLIIEYIKRFILK